MAKRQSSWLEEEESRGRYVPTRNGKTGVAVLMSASEPLIRCLTSAGEFRP